MRTLALAFSAGRKAIGASIVAAAVATAFVGAPAQAYWETFDGGGRVGDYLDLVSAANASGSRIEIGGVCASACTMKLGARNVCVRADAQLWFHAARNDDGRVNGLGTALMESEYPWRVRSWASRTGALFSTRFTVMSGAEAIALGVPNCDRSEPSFTTRETTPFVSTPVAGGPACYASQSVAQWHEARACVRQPAPSYTSVATSFTPIASSVFTGPVLRGRVLR